MKKLLVIIFILGMTGCSKSTKTLICSSNMDSENMKIDVVVETKWEEDELSTMKLDVNYHLGTVLTGEKKESFQKYIDTTMDSWKSREGVKYESNFKDDELFMKLDIDAVKGKETLEEFGIETSKADYKSLKKSFENENFQCK